MKILNKDWPMRKEYEIDQYEKKYCTELEEKRIESIKMMQDEGYAR